MKKTHLKRTAAAMLSFLLATGAMPFAPMAEMFEIVTVFAQNVNAPVTYIDKDGAKQTLTAAALTYVAAAITALLQLLRIIAMINRRRD